MATRERAGHKTLADAVRELIGTKDNRRHVHKLLGLAVDPKLPPKLRGLSARASLAGVALVGRRQWYF